MDVTGVLGAARFEVFSMMTSLAVMRWWLYIVLPVLHPKDPEATRKVVLCETFDAECLLGFGDSSDMSSWGAGGGADMSLYMYINIYTVAILAQAILAQA